jgi:hypothetical protein
MLSANPDLRPLDIQQILCATAKTTNLLTDDGGVPAPGSDEFGAGLVDAAAAVKAARKRVAVQAAA